jgi:hypothetical protein
MHPADLKSRSNPQMNTIKLAIQSSGLSVNINARKDNNIKDAPATEIFVSYVFLYKLMYILKAVTRDTSPQKRMNVGEAYPMLSEKRFKESKIRIIEKHF